MVLLLMSKPISMQCMLYNVLKVALSFFQLNTLPKLKCFRFHKVAISEFGLSMLMFILLNHYMFMEVMRYLHQNSGLEANQMHLKTHCSVYNKAITAP